MNRQESIAAAERRLAPSATRMAQQVVGRQFSVRSASNIVTTGRIVSAEFAGVRTTLCSVIAQWKVQMECGTNRVLREFVVSKLPR